MNLPRPTAPATATRRAPPPTPAPFLLGYVWRRGWQFLALLLIIGAASCAVAVQYGMKLIVDTMSIGDRSSPVIWGWLGLFVALIAVESLLWRIGGWLGWPAACWSGRSTLGARVRARPVTWS